MADQNGIYSKLELLNSLLRSVCLRTALGLNLNINGKIECTFVYKIPLVDNIWVMKYRSS